MNEEIVAQLVPQWKTSIGIIETAVILMNKNDFAQPIKPYLRYGDPSNRIIAIPAFLGGDVQACGIKWISSFPSNLEKGLPRAHSIIILNDPSTGKPFGIINSGLISAIRTAAVSGLMISKFLCTFPRNKYRVGIIGLGPIGQLHIKMVQDLLGNQLEEIYVHDLRIKEIPASISEVPSLKYAASWKEAYHKSDIFITCTTSTSRYINELPPAGSLQLNVSLRDYDAKILKECPHIIVDSWEEVCRENTDIEHAHLKYGLKQQDTHSIAEVVVENYFSKINNQAFKKNEYIIFNPMGMGIFDVAIAKHIYEESIKQNLSIALNH